MRNFLEYIGEDFFRILGLMTCVYLTLDLALYCVVWFTK